jgi:ParB family chromosome partitioning protein
VSIKKGEKMPTKKTSALGNGLETMIPMRSNHSKNGVKKESSKEVIKEVEVIKETTEVDINKVEPNKGQPRKNFDEDALHELSESIKRNGLIEPLIVIKGKKGFFTIIAGERRWRAAKLAGLKTVPIVVKEYTEQQIMEVALIENLQREDLNAIEEAEAYQQLIDKYHLKQDEVAEKVSKSRVAVTNALRLLKLAPKVRTMIVEDKIKSGHARALLSITDAEKQYQVATKIFDENLSVRETEKLVKKILSEKEATTKKDTGKEKNEKVQLAYKHYEEPLKQAMGTRVDVNVKNKDKGKIEISYFSPEEFERIVSLLLKKK